MAQNAYFIGTPVSTLGVAAIQVSLKCDQNCTVFVQQSPGSITGVGTVSVSGTGVTGVSTKFTRDFAVGDTITTTTTSGSESKTITTITSDTVLVTAAFSGTNAGAAYTYYPWDLSDQYTYSTSNNFGITVQAISSYERIKVTNIGTATSTLFRLQAALCPVVDSVPRSLDENGNLMVSTGTDSYGFEVENTPQGEQRTITPFRLVGKQFEFYGASGQPDSNFWVTYTLNSATTALAASTCTLTSGTNTAGAASVYSTRKARYTQANALRYRGNMTLGDTGIASNTRRWGAGLVANYLLTYSSGTSPVAGNVYTNNSQQFTVLYVTGGSIYVSGTGAPTAGSQTFTFVSGPGSGNFVATWATSAFITDGAYFQLSGTTFQIVTTKAGSPTAVSSGSFNGNYGASYTPVTTNVVWEIYWNNSTVWFVIGGTLLHKVSASSTTWADTISLNCFMDNINSGNSTSVTLASRSMSIARLGPEDTAPKWYYQHGVQSGVVLKTGAGRLKGIMINGWVNGTTISLYDAVTAANPIALIAPTTSGGTHQEVPTFMEYNLDFYNGLYLVTANATTDCTIIYE